jgi:hypothetical protein
MLNGKRGIDTREIMQARQMRCLQVQSDVKQCINASADALTAASAVKTTTETQQVKHFSAVESELRKVQNQSERSVMKMRTVALERAHRAKCIAASCRSKSMSYSKLPQDSHVTLVGNTASESLISRAASSIARSPSNPHSVPGPTSPAADSNTRSCSSS